MNVLNMGVFKNVMDVSAMSGSAWQCGIMCVFEAVKQARSYQAIREGVVNIG